MDTERGGLFAIRHLKAPLYCFNWPSNVGGADTKFVHLLWLLHRDFDITAVPNRREQWEQTYWRRWLGRLGIKSALLADLPQKLSGWGLSLCNGCFWTDGIGVEARRRGLKIAWSSEMMWHHAGECGAAQWGLMDKVLYVSEVQRQALEGGYLNLRLPIADCGLEKTRGIYPNGLRWQVTGNYIAPELFPWRDRRRRRRFPELVVGRLSRPDPAKFPREFARSYLRLGLREPRFRVMAWSDELGKLHPREEFAGTWELLPKEGERQAEFLRSLDLFVYDLREDFRESWGRAVVEAMLTGAVPLVPADARHHLRNLVPHGVGGFHCATAAEWREHAQALEADAGLRAKMSRAAREFAVEELCNAEQHREIWREALAE